MGDSEPREPEKDPKELASAIPPLPSSTSIDPSPRPTPRKLPKFPIDLNMPMMVYWPEDDNKIIVCEFSLKSSFLVSNHQYEQFRLTKIWPLVMTIAFATRI